MTMLAILSLSLIPGGLLFAAQRLLPTQPASAHPAQQRFYLYITVFALLCVLLFSPMQEAGRGYVQLLAIPLTIALIPITWHHVRTTPALHNRRTGLVMLCLALGLFVLAWLSRTWMRDIYVLLLALATGVIIALVWELREARARWGRFGLLIFVVLALLLNLNAFWYRSDPTPWISGALGQLGLLCVVVMPAALATVVGHLVYTWHQTPASQRGRELMLTAGIAILLVLPLAYFTSESLLLDRATDGLGGLFALITAALAVHAITVLLLFLLGWRRSGTILIYLLVMAALLVAFTLLDSKRDPRQVTAERSSAVSAAIEAYRAENGHFPARLEALAPRHMLVIPRPVIFREQTWCYATEGDSYHLAYVYRPTWGLPASEFSLRAAGGVGMDTSAFAPCEAMLADYQTRFGVGPP